MKKMKDADESTTKANPTRFEDGTQDATIEDLTVVHAWSDVKRTMFLLMVAFHAMMGIFMVAGIIPASSSLAEQYNVSEVEVSYLISVPVLLVGIFPILWSQVSNAIGLNQVLLLSVFGACVCNIAGGFCKSYGSQMATRVVMSFFICPPLGIGSKVATELFPPGKRGQKLGVWTLMSTLGAPGGPFIMGFVIQHLNHNWMFWVFAIINICQLIAYITLFSWSDNVTTQSHFWKHLRNNLKSRGEPPIKLNSMASCLLHKNVVIPIFAYAIQYSYSNLVMVVEMPIAIGAKFQLDAQAIGLQYISIILGAVIGEIIAGRVSDLFMRSQRNRGRTDPDIRLWIGYPGIISAVVGIVIWGVQLQNSAEGHWNVTPLIGCGISNFGNQVMTTTWVSFAVDSFPTYSAEIGLWTNLFRQTWGFVGPFYFPRMFERCGFAVAAGIFVVIITGFSALPIFYVHLTGKMKATRLH
ncbi:MFS general substrate transporter [Penicillium angulare]|uniref:MFS general substrate transporter n=1 Tax=Penicillium angulare TaxID=116970 RepID=A0A9W9K500_9EURO|nr:MFS general substrate transporter [Penicillium angulare]